MRLPLAFIKKPQVFILGTLIAFFSYGAYLFLNSPSVGDVRNNGITSKPVTPAENPPGHYSGKYISFDYPGTYKQTYSELSGTFLEVYHLESPKKSNRYISVGVLRESFGADSGIRYRQDHPQIYQPQASVPGSLTFVSHQNGFERTIFISHGGLVVSIAAVDSSGRDMTDDQNQILNSLQWN